MSFLHGILREMKTYVGSADYREDNRAKFFELTRLAVTEANRMIKEGEKSELAKNVAEIAVSIKEEKLVQDEFFYKLPEGLMVDLFCSIEDVELKQRFACLVGGGSELAKLIVEKCKEGNLDDAAMLYGSVYMDDIKAMDGLSGWRRAALDEVPRKTLHVLLEHPWDEKKYKGIKSWLKDEIESE